MKKVLWLFGFLIIIVGAVFYIAEAGAQTAQKPVSPPRILRNLAEYAPGAEGGKLQLDKSSAERLLIAYLTKNEGRLGLKVADLKLRNVRKAGRFWVATFIQYYRGIPVYGSNVGLVARPDGRIISFGSDFDRTIDLEVKPALTTEAAAAAAVKSLNPTRSDAVRIRKRDLVVWPTPGGKAPRHRLAWAFTIETLKPNAFALKHVFVDARDGRILKSVNALREQAANVLVRGSIWPGDPTQTTVIEPFSHLNVSLGGSTQPTDSSGRAQVNVPAGGNEARLEIRLKGPYAVVYRNSGTGADDFIDNEAKLAASARAGDETRFSWPASDEANVFYHVNKVRDWYVDKFGYAWEWYQDRDGFDRSQVIVCVESGPDFNGMGGMGGMWFGSQNGKAWARAADVIYHEFTHDVIFAIFESGISDSENSEGYSMDEGFADYFACALTNDPVQGESVSSSPRHLQNEMPYPDGAYNVEGHEGGMIISGACWDFRTSIDPAEADRLVFEALNVMAAWPKPYYFSFGGDSNFLAALLTVSEGRYDTKIRMAFQNHGLAGLTLTSSKETYGQDDPASFVLKNNDAAPADLAGSQYFIERESNGVWKEFFTSSKNPFKTNGLEARAAKKIDWDGWDNEHKVQAVPGTYRFRFSAPRCIPLTQSVEFKLSFPYVATDTPDGSPAFGGLSLISAAASFQPDDPVPFVLKNWGMAAASLQGSYYVIEKFSPASTAPGDRTVRPGSGQSGRWKEFFTSAKGYFGRPTLASQNEIKWAWDRLDNERLNKAPLGKYRVRLFVPKVTADVLTVEFDLIGKREASTAHVIKKSNADAGRPEVEDAKKRLAALLNL